MIIYHPCLQCDKQIESLTIWHAKHKFCSRKCLYIFQDKRLTIICEICNKSFKPESKGKEKRNKRFCSQKCYWKYLKGKSSNSNTKFKKGLIPWNKGKRFPQVAGSNNKRWKGGITILSRQIRGLPEYKQWIESVFQRDDWTCQECGKRGGGKHAHHIKFFTLILKENQIKIIQEAIDCKELWDISNGQTLCLACHRRIHSV